MLVVGLRPLQRRLRGVCFLGTHGGEGVFCYERALAVSSSTWFLIPMTESRGASSSLPVFVARRRAGTRHGLDVLCGQQGGQR